MLVHLKKNFDFAGLWQGVDHTDGSEVLRSIIKNNDGTFNIVGSETYFSGCNGGRGIITATAVLENGVLTSDDFTLECYDSATYVVDAVFVPDLENSTINESYEGDPFFPVILHRISKK
jgi:hypothetical protein